MQFVSKYQAILYHIAYFAQSIWHSKFVEVFFLYFEHLYDIPRIVQFEKDMIGWCLNTKASVLFISL